MPAPAGGLTRLPAVSPAPADPGQEGAEAEQVLREAARRGSLPGLSPAAEAVGQRCVNGTGKVGVVQGGTAADHETFRIKKLGHCLQAGGERGDGRFHGFLRRGIARAPALKHRTGVGPGPGQRGSRGVHFQAA